MAKNKFEYLVGIDVSAKKLQVAMIGVEGQLEEMEFSNDHDGHRKLVARLTKKGRTAHVGLEATGNYSLDLLLRLSAEKHIQVMQINPKAARRFADAQMIRAKTDQVDARQLLEYVKRMDFVPWVPPKKEVLSLRSLSRQLQALKETHVAEQNRLHAAKATDTTHPMVLKDLARGLTQLEKRIDALEREALKLIASSETLQAATLNTIQAAHRHATSIHGIGDRSAIYILGEMVLLPTDMSPREVVAHAGLDPRPRQSGSVDKPRSISKMGNRVLRKALFMPALAAVRFEPAIREFLIEKGKRPKVAIIAVMRKMLSSLWVMLRTGESFKAERFGPIPQAKAA